MHRGDVFNIGWRLSCFLLLVGLAIPVANAQTAAVLTAEIRDAETGGPVANAVVWTADSTRVGRSNAEGRFVFSGLAAGTYQVRAAAPGYFDAVSADVLLGAAGTRTVTVALPVDPRGPVASLRRRLPRITGVLGPNRLNIGQAETFRARISGTAQQPVEYRWNFGDGEQSEGNPVVHAFSAAGTYSVVVTTRNRAGTETATHLVEVLGPLPPLATTPASTPPPVVPGGRQATVPAPANVEENEAPRVSGNVRTPGLTGRPIVLWAEGGLSWMVRSSFSRPEAEEFMRGVRKAGFKAGLIRDAEEGKGSPVFRVLVGQFQSEEAALRAREQIMATLGTPAIIWQVPSASGF